MPQTWSYLAALGKDGALDWGGDWSGNAPASGYILADFDDSAIWREIVGGIREGRYNGRQTDWGTHAIKVNGPQLLALLTHCFPDAEIASQRTLLGKYVAYARSLGPDNHLAFVAAEL